MGVDLTVDSTVKSILELSSDLSLWLERIVVKQGDKLIKMQMSERSLQTVLSMGCQFRGSWLHLDAVRVGKANYYSVFISIVYDVGQLNEPIYSSNQIERDLCIVSDLLQPINAIAEQKKAQP